MKAVSRIGGGGSWIGGGKQFDDHFIIVNYKWMDI